VIVFVRREGVRRCRKVRGGQDCCLMDAKELLDVEEVIRVAESLIARDLERLRLPEGDEEGENDSLVHEREVSFGIGSPAGWKGEQKEGREGSAQDVVERLLSEREEALRAEKELNDLAAQLVQRETIKQNEVESKLRQVEAKHESLRNQKRARAQCRQQVASKIPSTKATGFRRKSLEELKTQVERERAKDLTFKPRIRRKNELTRSETPEECLARLAQPKSENWLRVEKERLLQEQKEMMEKCPFKPDISLAQQKKATSEWQRKIKEAYRNHVPIEKRLHLDASERWTARERAKRELEDAEMQAQPFRPKVNLVSEEIARQIDYEPIEKRAAKVQRERLEKLAKMQLEYEVNDENLTFRPTISEHSERLAAGASIRRGEPPTLNVVDRLLSRSNDISERKKQREKAWAEEQKSAHRYKPSVSKNTDKLLRKNKLFKQGVDFVTRQIQLDEERTKKEEKLRGAEARGNPSSTFFKPKTHKPERILRRTKPELLNETEENRYQRLAMQDSHRKEKLQEAIREHYYSQFSFKPIINRVSAEIVRETHKKGFELCEDLYRNERGKEFREMAKSQISEEKARDCTFKPKILRKANVEASEAIRHLRNDSEQTIRLIEEARRKKEEKIVQLKREKEYEDLKECTFTPEVNDENAAAVNSKSRVVVRGLGRHLELQELAKRQQEEKEERAAKVFFENAAAIHPDPYTIPVPFKLSKRAPSKFRKSSVETYSFKPKTNYSSRKKRVSEILS